MNYVDLIEMNSISVMNNVSDDSTDRSNGSFPIKLDFFQSTCHLLLASVGIPLNLIIAIVILACRRLRNKPRNVLWLGVTFCNILTLLTILVEVLAFHTENSFLCLCFVSMTGVAYTCLLYVLLLALLDRYAAIAHPLWHRSKVTVRRVVIGQIGGCSFFLFLIKFPFITQAAPLRCNIVSVHGKIIFLSNTTLFVLCIIAQIIVYTKTRQYFNSQRNGETSVTFVRSPRQCRETTPAIMDREPSIPHDPNQPEVIIISRISNLLSNDLPQNDLRAENGGTLQIHHHHGNRRMEVEATRRLLAGVLSLVLFTFPTLLLAFIDWGCRMTYGVDQCYHIGVLTFYARELLLGHLLYNPIQYMVKSREFSSTVTEKFRILRHQTVNHHLQRSPWRIAKEWRRHFLCFPLCSCLEFVDDFSVFSLNMWSIWPGCTKYLTVYISRQMESIGKFIFKCIFIYILLNSWEFSWLAMEIAGLCNPIQKLKHIVNKI